MKNVGNARLITLAPQPKWWHHSEMAVIPELYQETLNFAKATEKWILKPIKNTSYFHWSWWQNILWFYGSQAVRLDLLIFILKNEIHTRAKNYDHYYHFGGKGSFGSLCRCWPLDISVFNKQSVIPSTLWWKDHENELTLLLKYIEYMTYIEICEIYP